VSASFFLLITPTTPTKPTRPSLDLRSPSAGSTSINYWSILLVFWYGINYWYHMCAKII